MSMVWRASERKGKTHFNRVVAPKTLRSWTMYWTRWWTMKAKLSQGKYCSDFPVLIQVLQGICVCNPLYPRVWHLIGAVKESNVVVAFFFFWPVLSDALTTQVGFFSKHLWNSVLFIINWCFATAFSNYSYLKPTNDGLWK